MATATNPNPAQISAAIWRLWTDFDRAEPSALLGGVYAAKPGYHNYRGALPSSDYSTGRDVAADRRGSGIKASAIDLSLSDAAMTKYTRRLDAAARARDPRLYTDRGPVLREFIGTKDGRSVYCYVLVGGLALGVGADAGPDPGRDQSHLWHIHLSIIREFCEDWPAIDGVLSVLLGEPLPAWRARTSGGLMALSESELETLHWVITQGASADTPEGARRVHLGAGIEEVDSRVKAVDAAVARLEQAAAGDEARDKATQVALEQLAALIRTGGGDVDTGAILAEIRAAGAQTTTAVAQLQEQLEASRAEVAQLRRRLAEALDPSQV